MWATGTKDFGRGVTSNRRLRNALSTLQCSNWSTKLISDLGPRMDVVSGVSGGTHEFNARRKCGKRASAGS